MWRDINEVIVIGCIEIMATQEDGSAGEEGRDVSRQERSGQQH